PSIFEVLRHMIIVELDRTQEERREFLAPLLRTPGCAIDASHSLCLGIQFASHSPDDNSKLLWLLFSFHTLVMLPFLASLRLLILSGFLLHRTSSPTPR